MPGGLIYRLENLKKESNKPEVLKSQLQVYAGAQKAYMTILKLNLNSAAHVTPSVMSSKSTSRSSPGRLKGARQKV